MRRGVSTSALLYESIEDFNCDAATANAVSSRLKMMFTIFSESISNDGSIQIMRVTYFSNTSCKMTDMGCQILHTCCADIDSSSDQKITLFLNRINGHDFKFSQLPT